MAKEQVKEPDANTKNKTCGIIMPIAEHPDYPQSHWADVLAILKQAVGLTDFSAELVSNDGAVGLIQDRIVTNVYNNEIVICDVSSKNPNVMFELGMRLAFDKPTIIIKDDKTGYSFDIGGIEHIPYPSSLRFADIVDFQNDLVARINATYNKAKDDPKYSPFLKSFGRTIKPSTITQTEIPESVYLSGQIEDLKRLMYSFRDLKEENIVRHNQILPYANYNPNKDKVNNIVEMLMFKYRGMNENELYKIINKELSSNGLQVSDDYLLATMKSKGKMLDLALAK